MNRVNIRAEEVPLPAWAGAMECFLQKVLSSLQKDNWELSVLLCQDVFMRKLNAEYRNRDESTDVLSFSLGEMVQDGDGVERWLPGDIVISLETLAENARYFKTSEDEELRRLLVHGILHLDGFDHVSNDPLEPMLARQEAILAQFGGERIYGDN
ncbi:MAG: rRNA maturation RNase YbeY [Treponema sp.]|jgi:probable rRNA maturation factor|nr:rRNA maturation RNase YbeY [Treponema sp.]